MHKLNRHTTYNHSTTHLLDTTYRTDRTANKPETMATPSSSSYCSSYTCLYLNVKAFSWARSSASPRSRPLPSTTEDVMFTSDTTECAGCMVDAAGCSETTERKRGRLVSENPLSNNHQERTTKRVVFGQKLCYAPPLSPFFGIRRCSSARMAAHEP